MVVQVRADVPDALLGPGELPEEGALAASKSGKGVSVDVFCGLVNTGKPSREEGSGDALRVAGKIRRDTKSPEALPIRCPALEAQVLTECFGVFYDLVGTQGGEMSGVDKLRGGGVNAGGTARAALIQQKNAVFLGGCGKPAGVVHRARGGEAGAALEVDEAGRCGVGEAFAGEDLDGFALHPRPREEVFAHCVHSGECTDLGVPAGTESAAARGFCTVGQSESLTADTFLETGVSMAHLTKAELAQYIDHTLLKPEATPEDIAQHIAEAKRLGTYAVCISPSQLPVETLDDVHVATVVGFPSGAVKAEIKAAEAAQAVKDGAEEVDMVINLACAKEHKWEELEQEISAVRAAVPGVLKVIIESAALTDEEIVAACKAAEAAHADFVKTSTGFHPAGGASVHAVQLMRETVGDRLGVKASGGIRTAEAAIAMINAGATRLGLSASASILAECEE